jgi:GNAT superfamily N-acetyltransferase
MHRLISLADREELERWPSQTGLCPLTPLELAHHAPDAHWMSIGDGSALLARSSLWWTRTPVLPDHRVGIIGHYAARDAAAGVPLLEHCCRELAARGCTLAVGPMDGSTWRRYRFMTERGSEPVFFLEPDNPDDWPGHFLALGFRPMAHYISAVNDDLSRTDPRARDIAHRMTAQQIRIRPLNPDRVEDDLRRIYAVSEVSFRDNVLYSPISAAEFLEQYRPLLPRVRPELVLIAERHGEPVGFVFAVPDLRQAERGRSIETVVVKSIAVLPERAHGGLGTLLLAECHAIARTLGYTRAIHALIHEHNVSRNISRHTARPMRRYTLFAKVLGREP